MMINNMQDKAEHFKCFALFKRIIQGCFSHLGTLWRTVPQVKAKKKRIFTGYCQMTDLFRRGNENTVE